MGFPATNPKIMGRSLCAGAKPKTPGIIRGPFTRYEKTLNGYLLKLIDSKVLPVSVMM